jgi:hypothetical protein
MMGSSGKEQAKRKYYTKHATPEILPSFVETFGFDLG